MLLQSFCRSIGPTSIRYASLSTRYVSQTHKPPSFPTIPECPSPTCSCAENPKMPEGLEIDHSKPLNGTMAAYAEQVLICTGKSDWPSRIEEDNSGDNLAADIKELMGRGGMYSDPYNNVLITNASFPSTIATHRPEIITTSAYIVPSFKYIPFLPRVSFDSVQALVKGYLLPTKLDAAHDSISPIHKDRLLRSKEQAKFLPAVKDVKDILILICGHGGRDMRCGILAPILQAEFERVLPTKEVQVLKGAVEVSVDSSTELLEGPREPNVNTARIGLISHIGGHKFAGNVILYIPLEAKMKDGEAHPLAGCGVWYGRVEPKHVEGIVQETLLEGKVIEEMFRGGIRQGGEILRI
ncbi:040c3b90-2891-45e8-84f2-d47d682969fe [Sclerotinia trifoliorum]|uniref:Altered inheritance of mitochondria protein 32 n=1 Tax=Sclerotinia trifoliorum TaxID=28548 RepID=A0A8H2VLE7_9HELO|nr:040c3b90-2891-45e8-84f2-d47d682969fe [Sclerotinia trifoliorum]